MINDLVGLTVNSVLRWASESYQDVILLIGLLGGNQEGRCFGLNLAIKWNFIELPDAIASKRYEYQAVAQQVGICLCFSA